MSIHIGTSGWHYKHWLGNFYPADMRSDAFLEFFRHRFNTVEINNSFYHLPQEQTFIHWRDAVPKSFKFSVKASRYITHNKKLKDGEQTFKVFFDRVQLLEDRLGPILFQLPPKWHYNGERLEEFLAALPKGLSYVFEFRHADWLREEAYNLLRKYDVSFCIHDMPASRTPELVTNKLAYVRFHGQDGKYLGTYPDHFLQSWAEKLVAWQRQRITSYVYFNNDIGGAAHGNAGTLIDMVNKLAAKIHDK